VSSSLACSSMASNSVSNNSGHSKVNERTDAASEVDVVLASQGFVCCFIHTAIITGWDKLKRGSREEI